MTDWIGKLLLRSDVCYAAVAYAVALTAFNTREAVAYLERYLDYYLTRVDLWFDQSTVAEALRFLDEQNGTHNFAAFEEKWTRFLEARPTWSRPQGTPVFTPRMEALAALRARCEALDGNPGA